VRVRARACACNERVRLRVCSCVGLYPFALARCVRVCVPLSARVRVRAIPSDCNSAGVCSERVRDLRRCARPPIARRRLAVSIARPAPRVAAARAVAVRCDRPVVARVRPQVSPGRAARPARRGLRELGTRPWSTPSPAPSTSSAATAAPTCRTCGRAPTAVRGRTRAWGLVGGYTRWGTRVGYSSGVLERVRRGTRVVY
jgi:hypothetical protein